MDVELTLALVWAVNALLLPAWALHSGRGARLWRRVAPWPPLALGALLLIYVVSEDEYRNDGRSRRSVYDVEAITAAAIAANAAAAALGWMISRRPGLGAAGATAVLVSLVLTYIALIAMTN